MRIADIYLISPAHRRLVEASLAAVGLTEEAAVASGERHRPRQVAVACDQGLAQVRLDPATLEAAVQIVPWSRVVPPTLTVDAALRMERVEVTAHLALADPEAEVRATDRGEVAALVAFWAACIAHTRERHPS